MFGIGQLAIAQAAKAFLSLNVVIGLALLLFLSHASAVGADSNPHIQSFGPTPFKSTYTVLTDGHSDAGEKKHAVRPYIPPFIYKFHFVFALCMFFFIALMAASPSMTARALLLLPIVLCYGISHIFFAADQAEMVRDMMERYKRRIGNAEGGQ